MRRLATEAALAVALACGAGAVGAQAVAGEAVSGATAGAPGSSARALELLEGVPSVRELDERAERWVSQGFDHPDAVLARLNQLQQGLSSGPPLAWSRVLERTRGLVAARAGREAIALDAAAALATMGERDGVAAAEAEMLRAVLDDQLWRLDASYAHAAQADAAYARACGKGGTASTGCDHRGWWQVVRLLALRADRQGDRLQASRQQQRANELAADAGDEHLLAWGLSSLAVMSAQLNEADKSRREMALAERHARRDPTGRGMVRLLINRAVLANARSERGGSLPVLEEALALARKIPSPRLEAQLLASLSDEWLRRDRPREALAAIDRALPVSRQYNDKRTLPVMLHNAGIARVRLGDAARGKADLDAALALWQQVRARARVAAALDEAADALAAVGDHQDALARLHRARELRAEMDRDTREAVLAQLKARYQTESAERDLRLAERENRLATARLENQSLLQRVWMLASVVLALAGGVLVWQLRRIRKANRQLRQSEVLLKLQSERDPLTGLANRRHFREALAAQAADGAQFAGGLILLDIDHFKRLNDEYGHAVGDVVLVEVARRLSACVRSGDLACRWGGEEFLLHTPAGSGDAVEALALRVLGEIGNRPFLLADGREVGVTMSMAYARFPLPPFETSLPWEQAVNLVDMALYSAKSMGRDRAVGIQSIDVSGKEALAKLVADFEGARARGALRVRVTPRVA